MSNYVSSDFIYEIKSRNFNLDISSTQKLVQGSIRSIKHIDAWAKDYQSRQLFISDEGQLWFPSLLFKDANLMRRLMPNFVKAIISMIDNNFTCLAEIEWPATDITIDSSYLGDQFGTGNILHLNLKDKEGNLININMDNIKTYDKKRFLGHICIIETYLDNIYLGG
jgi:hypothetical protein